MDREIKFRAWDKINKEYLYQNKNGLLIGEKSCMEISTAINDNSFIVEQYTGLKDKNGKEIYEGDIVSHRYNPVGEIVEYDEHYSGFEPFRGDINCPDSETEAEVIGNIYENPELCEEK